MDLDDFESPGDMAQYVLTTAARIRAERNLIQIEPDVPSDDFNPFGRTEMRQR